MKRVFNHPQTPATGRKYWRSLEEFADTPEFRARLEREFPQGASELQGDEVTRRGFMQFMGASVALAGLGLTGCRRPELHSVPYSKGVEWQVPGNALHYATSMPRRGGALPLIATTYNGRPTKLEGNPNVPGFNGATDFLGQSAILDLYDPDRSKSVLKVKVDKTDPDKPKELRGTDYVDASWEDFWQELAILRHYYTKNQGDGLAILTEPSTSPTREAIRAELIKVFPKHLWVEYDAWKSQSPGGQPVYSIEKADVILSLDADFLGNADGNVQTIAGFAAGRRRLGKSQETMSRLYAVEARFSLTGGMADHRLRLPSSQIQAFATLLVSKLGTGSGNSFGAFADANIDAWATGVAADLTAAKGRSLIICGSQQPAAVHMLVAQLNEALGNYGNTVTYRPDYNLTSSLPNASTLSDLAEAINQGTVKTLLVLGGNPAFNAPADLGLDGLLSEVEQVIRHGLHVDETSATATTHVPAAHFLESWGDSRAYDGTYLCQQPLILPFYEGISEIELLSELAALPKAKGAERIIDTFAQVTGLDKGAGMAFDNAWRQFVHDGFLPAASDKTYSGLHLGDIPTLAAEPPPKPIEAGKYELNFFLGTIDDGRYANNGWLQEFPEPVTKLTWDNALYLSPKTADALGVSIANVNGNLADVPGTDFSPRTSHNYFAVDPMTAYPMVKVTTADGLFMELPVIVAPGQADQSLSIAVGWGRTAPRLTEAARAVVTPPLRVAEGAGLNVFQLRTAATPGFIVNVTVEKLDKTYSLAVTQEHNSMEGRGIVREAPLDYFHEHADFVQEIGMDKEVPQGEKTGYQNYEPAYVPPSLNSKDYQPDRPAWGMVMDLNTCVGCGACVIACQAENNIPIVGKFQVLRGREMHWIRNDRYFASDSPPNSKDPAYLEDPQMLLQPMACQQCENAPCEPVCPVNATVHNEEGLNVMAYNRCIGTRYCANNCPYKVRRFNFFNYNDRPIQNVKLPVLGMTNELFLGPFAGKDGPLTYKGSPDSIALQKNPNVSVRIRGVMEKCTYCVQRIEEAKIDQLRKSNENGEGSGDITIATDSFKVACQQACPAEAIVFGNLNDPASKVTIMKQDERNYGVLAYLGTRPRTTYLGRVRNPNPAMPGAANIGHTSNFDPGSESDKNGTEKSTLNNAPVELNKLNLETSIG